MTRPNGSTPPGEQPSPEDHGRGGLWTVIPADGTIRAKRQFVHPDGSMRIKFPWWGGRRSGAELSVAAVALRPPGGVARAQVMPGQTGAPHFWASSVTFPTAGCWRVTASARHAGLTVVVFVVKADA